MQQPCDREGTFQAQIESYGLREVDSGAISVTINARLLALWDGQQWEPWDNYDMVAEGDIWIVKKDGQPNQNGIESLVKFAGWDGDMISIPSMGWQPTPCQVVVKRDDYKDQTRYKIAFINDHDRRPGAMSNVDATKAKDLQNRYGAQLRAIVGNARRNGPAPNAGAPKPPPPPKEKPEHMTIPTAGPAEDPIPF